MLNHKKSARERLFLLVFWLLGLALGGCEKKPMDLDTNSHSLAMKSPCQIRPLATRSNVVAMKSALKQCPRTLTGAASYRNSPICRANRVIGQVENAIASSHRVAYQPLPDAHFLSKTSLKQVASWNGLSFMPYGDQKRVTLEYCQAHDPKVMDTTGGSCMAMSWYWALAQFKDDLALGILEQESLKKGTDQRINFNLEKSEVFHFFNTLRAGMTEGINQVQVDIESNNNKLFNLLRLADAESWSKNPDRVKDLAEKIVSLRNDQISFLKLVPFESNPAYRPLVYSYLYPSHNQYPDLKLYPIPEKADFKKILEEIQLAIKTKVEQGPQNDLVFPLTGRKTGIFVFHLIGDGTAHAMGLKYTYLPNLERSYWSFFDPSSGEVIVGDQIFIATMLEDFQKKRYSHALAYTFHQVLGTKD